MTKTKKIVSIMIAALLVAVMFVVPFTASAVQTSLIDTTQTGSLSIYKYEMSDTSAATHQGTGETTDASNVPNSATPLADVTFTVKKVAEVTNGNYYKPNGVTLPTPAAAASMNAIGQTRTATTNASGFATLTGLPLGIYLVSETASPSNVTARVADFVVSIPMTNTAETGWNYNVTVYPKNQTSYDNITLSKKDFATNAGLQGAKFTLEKYYNGSWQTVESNLTTSANGTVSPTSAVANNYKYRFVETTAPAHYIYDDTAKYTEFYLDGNGQICDPDNHSTVINANGVVEVTNSKPSISKYIDNSTNHDNSSLVNETTLTAGDYTYYTVKVKTPNVDMKEMSSLSFTDTVAGCWTGTTPELVSVKTAAGDTVSSGQYEFASNNGAVTFNFTTGTNSTIAKNTEYLISFKAKLVSGAGSTLTNKATLTYSTDTTDNTKSDTMESNQTEIGVGGYQLLKVDKNDTPLSGVEFKLYASLADAQAGTNPVTAFTGASGTTTGTTFTTDSNGYLNINGIFYGNDIDGYKDYWLVETKTLSGYNLLKDPIEIRVNKNSGSYANTNCKVVNSEKTPLPITGGQSIILLYIVGGILISVSGAFLIIRSVKRKRNEG